MTQNAVSKGESDLVTDATASRRIYFLALLHLDRTDHPIFFPKTQFENAELQRKNAELMERCKTLASRVPAWPKGYRPTRKALDEKKRYDRRTN